MSLTEEEINGFKVADLRKQLSKRRASYKGITKKADLQEKLRQVVAEEAAAASEEVAEEVAAEEVAEEVAAEEVAEEVAEEAEVAEEVAEEAEVAEEVAAEAEVAEEVAAEAEVAEEVAEEAEVAEEVAEEEVAEEVVEEAEVAEEVAEEAEVAAEEAEVAEEVAEEAEVAEEVAEEAEVAEEPAFVAPEKPSGPDANVAILSSLESKGEEELTQVEKDIIAAKARQAKFNNDSDEATPFRISDELKRRLRAQRFGAITVPAKRRKGNDGNPASTKVAMEEVPVDDEEAKKRAARAARFGGQPGEPIPTKAEEPATEEPATEEPATEEPATEEPDHIAKQHHVNNLQESLFLVGTLRCYAGAR